MKIYCASILFEYYSTMIDSISNVNIYMLGGTTQIVAVKYVT